jgi:hypothetical protein
MSSQSTRFSSFDSRGSFASQSESSEGNALRLENQQLRELVIQLSEIVFKNLMDAKRPRLDCPPVARPQPSLCSPNKQLSSAPSFWPAGARTL